MRRTTELAGVLALLLAAGLSAQGHRTDLAPTGPREPVVRGGSPPDSSPEYLTRHPLSRAERHERFEKAKGFKAQAGMAWRKGQLDSAVVHLRKILALGLPDEPRSRQLLSSVCLALADVLKQLRRWGEAEKACVLGLQLLDAPGVRADHLHLELYELHAELLDQLGRRQEAEQARQRYLRLFRQEAR